MLHYSKDGITIAIVQDIRKELANGDYPIKVRVVYNRKAKYFSTGKSLSTHDWNILWTSKTKEHSRLRKDIENSFELVRCAVEDLAYEGQFSFERLTTLLRHTSTYYINDLIESMIADLKEVGRYNNAMVYSTLLRCIEKYKGRVPLSAITVRWVALFADSLEESLATTTIAIRMRTLRSVLNEAIKRNLMRQSDYPFGRGKYEIQEGEGRKMALTIEQVGQIARYEDSDVEMRKHRDYWLFLYLCNGINMADFVQLRYKDIVNGEIHFMRQKTAKTTRKRKEIVVVVSEPMREIIERWGNPPAPNAFIFPFLKGGENAKERTLKTQIATKSINRRMKRIGKALGFADKITTYTARHSFATVLKRAGANIAYISESLGHSDLKTTEHYLASFEREEREKNADILTKW